jgi:hypothetical protein
VQVHFDQQGVPGAGQCGATGVPSSNLNSPPGSCGTDLYSGPGLTYPQLDLRFTPPGPSGGACTASSSPTGNVSYAAQDMTCKPDNPQGAGCSGNQCTLTLPAPYLVCVTKNGNQPCPGAPFTHAHDVGNSVQLDCGGCGCNWVATCTGTMKLFTDNQCKNGELDVPVDDQCHNPNASANFYKSYQYAANPPANVACASTGTPTAQNVSLQGEQTICCTQ